jgi:hypothetical protein
LSLQHIQYERRLGLYEIGAQFLGEKGPTCSGLANEQHQTVMSGNNKNAFEASELVDEKFMFRFHMASVLAADVAFDVDLMDKIDYYRTIYERFDAFDDGLDDAAAVAKINDACYGKKTGGCYTSSSKARVLRLYCP